jgi:hypothetical protein
LENKKEHVLTAIKNVVMNPLLKNVPLDSVRMVNGAIGDIAVTHVEQDFEQELVQIRHHQVVELNVLVPQLSFVMNNGAQCYII